MFLRWFRNAVILRLRKGKVLFFLFSDAVIIGASSVKHLEENLTSAKHGPIHEGVLKLKNDTYRIIFHCFV